MLLLAALGVLGITIAGCGASSSGGPGSGAQGPVTITLAKAGDGPDTTLVATIHNGLPTSIWTTDHNTNCTVVTLEAQGDGAWQIVAPCQLMMRTRLVEIAAGSTLTVSLHYATEANSDASWPPGLYRAGLAYSTSRDTVGDASVTVYSPELTVS